MPNFTLLCGWTSNLEQNERLRVTQVSSCLRGAVIRASRPGVLITQIRARILLWKDHYPKTSEVFQPTVELVVLSEDLIAVTIRVLVTQMGRKACKSYRNAKCGGSSSCSDNIELLYLRTNSSAIHFGLENSFLVHEFCEQWVWIKITYFLGVIIYKHFWYARKTSYERFPYKKAPSKTLIFGDSFTVLNFHFSLTLYSYQCTLMECNARSTYTGGEDINMAETNVCS